MKQFVHQTVMGLIMTLMIQSGLPAGYQGPSIHSSRGTGQQFYSILGAVGKPGVYEFKQNSIHVSELIKRSGGLNLKTSNIHIVRNGRAGLMENVSSQNDPLLLKGDVVFIPGAVSDQNQVQVTLLNLISKPARPVTLLLKKEMASLDQLLTLLGQSPESVRVIHAKASRKTVGETVHKLTTGTVLVFKPELVVTENIPALPNFFANDSRKFNQIKFVENHQPEMNTSHQKPLSTLPIIPVPIRDPDVGIVNSDGTTIGLPPARPEDLDFIETESPVKELKASSKIVKKQDLQLPLLAKPSIQTGEKESIAKATVVPPPPQDEINSLLGKGDYVADKASASRFSQFKVSNGLIAGVMIGAILITGVLLGSMVKQTSRKKVSSVTKLVDRNIAKVSKVAKNVQPVRKPLKVRRKLDRFDLEALIQDELTIEEKKACFPNMANIYGTPAGPRMIRVEAKEEFKAPHYIREVSRPTSKRKQSVSAGVDISSSSASKKIQEKISSRLKQADQLISERRTITRTDNASPPVRSKRVKLKKPTLEISIEQKLGMLDQVLSSVQRPDDENQQV
jgi:SLBB domain